MVLGATVLSLSLTACGGGDDNAAGNNNKQGAKVQSNEVRPIAKTTTTTIMATLEFRTVLNDKLNV